LPVFLILIGSALDLGRAFYANISLHNAAREGAM
jgi:Flp pilus assembly protein TadG